MDHSGGEIPGLAASLAPAAAGVLGRLLYHFQQVSRGRRPAVGLQLLCDLMIALPMGFVGKGAATWCGLSGDAAFALAIIVSYLGPWGLQQLCVRWMASRVGKTS